MKLLALDTSGKVLSVSLAENKKLLLEFNQFAPNMHSQIIVKTVDVLLKQLKWGINQINKICVTTGPGSFTGIRIGITYARSICQWLKIPAVGVSTLDVLAAGVHVAHGGNYLVSPVIDALNGRVFTALYDGISRRKIMDYKIDEIDSILKTIGKRKKRCVFVGDGLQNEKVIEKIKDSKLSLNMDFYITETFPRSSVLAMVGFEKRGVNYNQLRPFYLKRLTKKKISHGRTQVLDL